MRQVALIGLSPSNKDAPWEDPSWEKWGLALDPEYWARCDRLFELHGMPELEAMIASGDLPSSYISRLEECPFICMQEAYFQNATRFPLESVIESTGDYFSSSIAYMLALAIHEKVDRIGLWGIDMKDDSEYAYQKPNAEYLIGIAKGRGIDIVIHESSPLCKFKRFENGRFTYEERYGWAA